MVSFFYPLATAGLIQLTTRGGGLYAFADYLSGSRTPLMAGYLGAYIFLTQMLLRRYFAKDVTPKVYVFAVNTPSSWCLCSVPYCHWSPVSSDGAASGQP